MWDVARRLVTGGTFFPVKAIYGCPGCAKLVYKNMRTAARRAFQEHCVTPEHLAVANKLASEDLEACLAVLKAREKEGM